MLRPIPGVGDRTARAPPGRLPELGRLTGERVAALAGLAPRANDSGARAGPRSIFGGRKEVRTAPYMATPSAVRHDPPLRAMYARLRAAGRRPKVAPTAIARELLTIADAMIRDMTPWTPDPAPRGADAPAPTA